MKSQNLTEDMLNEYRRVAYYYYKAGMTQDMIAKRMRMSRQRVNRIVSACAELGIVKITIEGLEQCNLELETGMEEKFGVNEVRIVDNTSDERLMADLGTAAAEYLKSVLQENDVVGISRGRTTAAMIENWGHTGVYPENITVTQLIGSGKEIDSAVGADRIVYGLSDILRARPALLHVPVLVHSAELKSELVGDPYYLTAYERVKKTRVAVVGIGSARSQWRHMVSLYPQADMPDGWETSVAGEVCTHFFDREGKEVIPPFHDRLLAITLEDYKKIPLRIGVAGGAEKADAIRAALKGKYINVLITDYHTAQLL